MKIIINMFVLLTCLLLSLGIGTSATGFSLLTSKTYVAEGGSFFQYIVDKDNKLTNCSLEFTYDGINITCELDLRSITRPKCGLSSQYVEDLAHRITSLENKRCGFRLDNASSTDPSSWTITGSGVSSNYQATFKVVFYPAAQNYTSQMVTIGGSTDINCGSSTQNQDYCHLYNPQGELVSSKLRCEFYIGTVTLQDIGRWYCTVGAIQYFQAMVFTVDVVTTEYPTTEGWVENHDEFIAIGCRIKNMNSNTNVPSYCMMVSPHGEELVVRPGSVIKQYTSFNTNLQAQTCAIEIRKPLLVHDMGIWRCEINNRGYVLQVGNNADYVQNTKSVAVELHELFTVRCLVPYSSIDCFITSPNGTRYMPNNPTRSEIGECAVTLRAEQEHNGMWLCHFFKHNDPESHKVQFDVTISNGMTCSRQVSVSRGYEVQLFCRTGRAPLQYCWFVSPDKEVYQLESGINSTRIKYIGRGLEYGDCGIKISNALQSDQGNWTCITRLGAEYKVLESTNTLLLTITFFGSTLSTVVGSIIGVVAIVSATLGINAYRSRRRLMTTSQTALNDSISIDNSDAEVMFSQEERAKYT